MFRRFLFMIAVLAVLAPPAARADTRKNLSERLEHLERSVKRAAEAIAALRKEREALQARVAAMEQDRLELQSLRQERKDVLTQVDGILKELDKLDL